MSQVIYRQYVGESDLPHVMGLVQNELSEPYVIYTYRYFLHQWSVHVFDHTTAPQQSILTRLSWIGHISPFL